MAWFNKIFKGSSHQISESYSHGNDEDEKNSRNPFSAGDGISDEDNEDVDQAIAVSILEANENREILIDRESQLEEDEQLARAIQESLNFERTPQVESESPPALHGNGHIPPIHGNSYFPPRYENGNPHQPFPAYTSTGYRICAGCNSEIGQGRFLSCMNGVWHPECFCCSACNTAISDYEFSMSGNFPYHKSCYKEYYHPKCDICRQFLCHYESEPSITFHDVHKCTVYLVKKFDRQIPTNPAGLIEYRAHPFWSQKYCPSHELDGTPRCCSCERMEPRKTKYVALSDGRNLCLECLDSAVLDTNECQPLYRDIQKFYENLNMKVEQQVPLLLVERRALNEAREGEKSGHHHIPETRGLCLSEEQTISTVRRRPAIGEDRIMGMMTEPYKLTRHCEVTAILILFGLPRLLTGSILAHEVMHAWLRLQGYPTLRPDIEEGICQVLARLWLETEIVSESGNHIQLTSSTSYSASARTTRSQFEMKLREFFKHQIEMDASPVYGEGFRAGQLAVQKYGLQSTLNHIRMTGNFPF